MAETPSTRAFGSLETGEGFVEAFARPNSRITDAQARICFAEIVKLTPEQRTATGVAEAAKDPENPMHPIIYHTDRDTAADRYYRNRARTIMNSIEVRIMRPEGVIERPAFFSVQVRQQEVVAPRRYVLYTEAFNNEEWKLQIVARVRADMEAYTRRYRRYREILQDVDPELADLLKRADEVLGVG